MWTDWLFVNLKELLLFWDVWWWYYIELKRGSSYILEIDILKFFLRKENLEFASKLLAIMMMGIGEA